MVVFHHSLSATAHYGTPATVLDPLGQVGQSGVDIFFVISGFVMVVSTNNSPKSAGQFLLGRIRRIVPIYWVLTLGLAAILTVAGNTGHAGGLWHLLTSLVFSSQLATGTYPILFVGWTLEYEMLFYVLFAIGLALRVRNAALVVPTIVIVALSLLFPVSIALEFVAGMLVAQLYLKDCGSRRSGALALILGATLLSASIIWPQPLEYRWFVWGVPATLIVYGALFIGQFHRRGLIFLGDASYSIYLIQAFSVTLAFKVMLRFWPQMSPGIGIMVSVLFTSIAGALSYVVIEKRLTGFYDTARLRARKHNESRKTSF